MMKIVIAGSRDLGTYKDERGKRIQKPLSDCPWLEQAFNLCDWRERITEIVSGKAIGVDNLGEQLADKLGLEKAIFPAQWDKYGKRAGPLRNSDMADYADIGLVIMNSGGSSGSKNMVQQMERRKKPVMVFEVVGSELCQIK